MGRPATCRIAAVIRLRPLPRFLRVALPALLLLWSAWALGVETTSFAAGLRRPADSGAVAEWRLATRGAEGLGAFLTVVDRHLPADHVVLFDSHLDIPGQQYFLTLWAAYYLPRQRVIHRTRPGAWQAADYVVLYNSRYDAAQRAARGLTEVFRHPSGVLYRVDR